MSTSLGAAFLTLRADTSRVSGDVTRGVASAGAAADGPLKRSALRWGSLVAGGLAVGLGAFTKKSVGLEAEFGATMNTLAATADVPRKQMRELQKTAMQMGADTVFSANDASQAMLELARGGMSAATIQGGALKGTLTLAAAGELSMGEAANTAVKAMGAFGLKGKDMNAVAAALAGGANASSASVRDMAFALAQGGLAASNAGLTIQETTGALAAFSNAGLEGSDAGTSLKTMLLNLTPSTEKQSTAFAELGLWSKKTGNLLIKKNGEYKSLAQMSELLRKGTEKLSASERDAALKAAFGTDAFRAANILRKEGAKGINQYVKATSNQNAAEEQAQARMRGSAGALERMHGTIETVGLAWGKAIKPVTIWGANLVSTIGEKALPYIDRFGTFLREKLVLPKNLDDLKGYFAGLGSSLKNIDWGSVGAGAKSMFSGVGDALKDVDWAQAGQGVRDLVGSLRELGPTLAQVGTDTATDTLTVFATVIGFVANHVDLLAKAMPILVGAFLLYKTAQIANNVAGRDSLLGFALQLIAQRAQIRQTRQLTAELGRLTAAQLATATATTAGAAADTADAAATTADTAATAGNTAAEQANTAATNRGIFASIRHRVATIASAVAQKAVAAATWLWAAAQRALNVVLRMNPIGLVLIALTALAAGLVLAYKKSDTFRKIVDRSWAAIKQAVSDAWTGYIRPALVAFAGFLTGTVFPAVRRFWSGVVKPTMNRVGQAIVWLWQSVIKPTFSLLVGYWTQVLFPTIRRLWSVAKSVTSGVAKAVTWMWNNVVKPVLTLLVGYWTNILFPTIRRLWTIGKQVMTGLGKAVSNAWNNVIKPVFNALKTFITDNVVPAFRRGVDKIGDIWAGLKNTAKKPVRFLISTIYNDGLRKMLNLIPGVEVGEAPVPFAQGGQVRGGVPGKDSVRALMMPDEHVWTGREVMRFGGQAAMYRFRKLVGAGRVDWERLNRDGGDLGAEPKFAEGGGLSPAAIARAKSFAAGEAGKPYIWGGVGPGGYDCSGFMSAITRVLWGMSPYGRVGTSSSFPWAGFKPGWGQFTVGAFTGSPGHVAGTLDGMNVESTNGSVRVGGAARGAGDSLFTRIGHLGASGPPGGGGGFFDFAKWRKIIKSILGLKDKLTGWAGDLSGMKTWGPLLRRALHGIGDKVVGYINDKIPDFGPLPDNPLKNPFDNGGVAYGAGVMRKATVRPERVLSPRQTESFDRLVELLDAGLLTGRGNRTMVVRIGDREFIGWVEDIADGRVSDARTQSQFVEGLKNPAGTRQGSNL